MNENKEPDEDTATGCLWLIAFGILVVAIIAIPLIWRLYRWAFN